MLLDYTSARVPAITAMTLLSLASPLELISRGPLLPPVLLHSKAGELLFTSPRWNLNRTSLEMPREPPGTIIAIRRFTDHVLLYFAKVYFPQQVGSFTKQKIKN